jgi:hypothetical protein
MVDHAQGWQGHGSPVWELGRGCGAILGGMSAKNVEIVRLYVERWSSWSNSASGPRADVIELWDVDADYYPVGRFPEARPCHGIDEISQFFDEYLQAWSGYDAGIRDVIAVGDFQVLVCATPRAEGRESGVELEGDLYHCVWLRHGRFYRWEDHLTLQGALRGLGLKGETLEAAGLRGQQ